MTDAARIFATQPIQGSNVSGAMTSVERDSRRVQQGSIFFAQGEQAQANAEQAVDAGAALVVSESPLAIEAPNWLSPHVRWSFAQASLRAQDCDEDTPPVVAVTGTKGKTTTSWAAWWALGLGAARVGTVGWHDGRGERSAQQTTPPPEEMHAFLAGLDLACPGLALEASSHAGDQHRLAGIRFEALVVTGIERDHLDYHGTFAAYVSAKLELVHQLRSGGTLIVNADDPRAGVFAHAGAAVGARVIQLGFDAGDARLMHDGNRWRLHLDDGDLPVPCALPGRFNVFNVAAGALLAEAVGIPLPTALARMADMPQVPGRLERCAELPITYVDYAHTARSLANVVEALRAEHPGRRLVVVFGCGGDRDHGKRGPMGRAALTADIAVLTTDNPRSEDPQAIAAEVIIGSGVAPVIVVGDIAIPADARLVVIADRRAAIATARELAGPDGVVAVCGKGHETEQIIGSRRDFFDDRAEVRRLSGGAQ